ncbi:MAG TPA: SIMPL domain-containing protein [Candidatus Saccharimonadales bacterium]|nr:SIMPL domain-containing protein [Candidatus Saccharimonadales bacterium]
MKLSSELKIALKSSLLSAIFTVLLLMLVNYFFNHTWNFFVNSAIKTQTFQAQGTGTATATPDQSNVSFIVTKTAKTLQDAQNQANTSMNTIVSDFEKAGVTKKDIQTSNYSSYPNYDNGGPNTFAAPSSQTIISYTVSEDVNVTLHDNSKTTTVIDIATKDNAENISGPNLAFSDAKQQQLEDDARVQAINNAKQKAQTLANAAGIHLGKVINVQENQAAPIYPFHPMMLDAKSQAAEGSAPTQINQGQNTVTTTVTLTYQTN